MPKYFPEPPPEPKLAELRALGEYTFRELNRISQSIFTDVYLNLEETFVEPDRPINGDIVFADGTSWNPGNGRGVYAYIGGVWVKLGIGIGDDLTLDDIIANDITFTGKLIGEINVPDNLCVNGAMQHSQQNGFTANGGNGYYPADEWPVFWTTSTGIISSQLVASVTPNGSANRVRISVTTADTSIAAGEYLMLRHPIEGYLMEHLQWGTASAKALIVRFGFKGPAGTWAVTVSNAAGDRSYVREFTISAGQANTDTEQTLVFPGDTSGTWLKDDDVGAYIRFTMVAGSTYQQSPNAWVAALALGTSSTSNGLAVNTNVFEFFDVGMYADIDGTGIPPKWKHPDYGIELRRCQRYWQLNPPTAGNWNEANTNLAVSIIYKTPMRAAPTLALVNGTNTSHRPGVAFYNISSIASAPPNYFNAVTATLPGAQIPGQILGGAVSYNARL